MTDRLPVGPPACPRSRRTTSATAASRSCTRRACRGRGSGSRWATATSSRRRGRTPMFSSPKTSSTTKGCSDEIPARPIHGPREPHGCAGQVCQTCPERPPRACTGACTDSGPVQKWRAGQPRLRDLRASVAHRRCRSPEMPSALDNGQRSPRKLLRAVVARLLGRSPEA
jgi:hypothetical protein